MVIKNGLQGKGFDSLDEEGPTFLNFRKGFMNKIKKNYFSICDCEMKKIEKELLDLVIKGAADPNSKTIADFLNQAKK